MKVAVVLGDVSPVAGGGFTFQDDLLQALLRVAPSADHEFVIVGNFSGSLPKELTSHQSVSFVRMGGSWFAQLKRVGAVVFAGFGFFLRMAGFRSALDRKLESHAVDMVWFATPFFQETDLPYIYTVWDLQHRIQPWFPEVSARGRWEYRERSYRAAIQRAYFVIVANAAAEEEISLSYGLLPSRVRTLPHPTPSFALDCALLPHQSVRTELLSIQEYFLYPAQFGAHKNHIGLLRAIALVKERIGRTFNVVFVGSDRGNLSFIKQTALELGIDTQVHILGFIERNDLLTLYKNATALIFPSFFGPENLPPLEAFALGCPVVASRVSGAECQLGDAALLFDPANFEEMADAMVTLVDNAELRESLIKRGRERALRWRADDYIADVLDDLTKFSAVRACWS